MDGKWLYTISAKSSLVNLNLKEIWRYRDLLTLFVKRDIITVHKQTILGPLWYFIQPLFTTVIFTLVFNNIANISTGNGVPGFLFNMAGITCWGYFKQCLVGTSNTFTANQGIFGKVYFPRVIIPLSAVVSNLVKFGVQLIVFVSFYVYFKFYTNSAYGVSLTYKVVFMPLLVLCMGLLGLGFGMIITSMTTKYRDLSFLVGFGVQLLMYASAVMYPISLIQDKIFEGNLPSLVGLFIIYNPMTILIETFRVMTLGVGEFSILKMCYVLIFSLCSFFTGLIVFNNTEKNFIDTV